VLYSPWKTLNPTVTGSMFSEFSTINGHRKLFQTPMKVKMPSVARAGPESGMMMRRPCWNVSYDA